jgi:serpin B
MSYAGAKSSTATELKNLLGFAGFKTDQDIFDAFQKNQTALTKSSSGDVALNTANKLYPNADFKVGSQFSKTLQSSFGSQVQQLNFANNVEASKTINDWVSSQTKSKIKDLVPSDALSDLTRLVLVNAIYFKANWANCFKKEQTSKETFTLADNSQVTCDMMKLYGKKFQILVGPFDLPAMIVELPYVGNNVSMNVILPNQGVKLSDLEAKLTKKLLDDLVRTISASASQKVNIHLPKFKLEYKNEVFDSFV